MIRRLAYLASLAGMAVVAACSDSAAPSTDSPAGALAASSAASSSASLHGQYIVVFNRSVPDAPGLARRLVAQAGGTLGFTYEHAIKGFSARLPDAAVAGISHNPNVAYVEADQVVTAVGVQSPTPSWGLDRVDARSGLDNSYTYNTTASGVTAYIIDTGILTTHSDFGGRASSGYDFVDNDANATDCNGHGTHVAGTVGGTSYGIAKGVSLVAVRVLNCSGSGSTSGVIAGIDWVTQHHASASVANMSLGGGFSQALNDAVTASINSGVTFAIAAGNGDRFGRPQDACASSPASTPAAITVGATTSADHEASFSNYGTCVDILAPGVSIKSDWYSSSTATNTISGTSMATPHVTGAAALYLAQHPGSTPAQVAAGLVGSATSGAITLNSTTRGTPNLLLYTLFDGSAPPGNSAPTAAFSWNCPDRTCTFDASGSSDDGSIVSYGWTFGDGSTGSGVSPSHTYAGSGTSFNVTLTVLDNGSPALSSQVTHAVTVPAPPPPPSGIVLTASGYKVKGRNTVDLAWSGASSANVDIFRDGAKVATTANDGAYTNSIGSRGGATYTYRVCEAGTSTCSSDVSVVF